MAVWFACVEVFPELSSPSLPLRRNLGGEIGEMASPGNAN